MGQLASHDEKEICKQLLSPFESPYPPKTPFNRENDLRNEAHQLPDH